ncbi:cell filamentation protein Fic [Candidatus Woesearchaeota archaeon CG10_big_fil_rev_8_21_14_0_10_34_8]|nr:MAG: cell filamentation protein Fic [Candidatus Woesearchaeota archaeon CG10_big_fil_rev_8_21_14_0_10_34_8]
MIITSMDPELYNRIIEKKKQLDKLRPFPKSALKRLQERMHVEMTYNSNAIEGNTLTLGETRMILEEGITISGKLMREHFEALNHKKALDYIESIVKENKKISEEMLCRINEFILNNIEDEEKGIYRLRKVYVQGACFIPAKPDLVPKLMRDFIFWTNNNKSKSLDIITFVAITHEKFTFIHPFIDGNGRCARLLTNLQFMQNGYPPITFLNTERKKYIRTLDLAHDEKIEQFVHFMARCMERSLTLWLDALKIPCKDEDLISLAEATKHCNYSQEYLSLLARKGTLKSIKLNRNWLTTKKWVNEYVKKHNCEE